MKGAKNVVSHVFCRAIIETLKLIKYTMTLPISWHTTPLTGRPNNCIRYATQSTRQFTNVTIIAIQSMLTNIPSKTKVPTISNTFP